MTESSVVQSTGVVLASEAAQLFLVAANLGGNFLEGDAEVSDLRGQLGQRRGFTSAVAMLFDDGAKVGVSVEGGPAEPGAVGDRVEGDRCVVSHDVGAGLLDALLSVV